MAWWEWAQGSASDVSMSFEEGQLLVTEKFWDQASPRNFNSQTAVQAHGSGITVAASTRLNASPKVADPVGGMPMDPQTLQEKANTIGKLFIFVTQAASSNSIRIPSTRPTEAEFRGGSCFETLTFWGGIRAE